MRIGIDVRMAYYTEAGIGQYIRRLVKGLSRIDSPEKFVLFQSRKDAAVMANASCFKRRNLWTPSHHRVEQWVLPIEFAFSNIDLLHSPDFIPPFRRNMSSVITVHDLHFLRYPHFLTEDAARYYGQIDEAVRRTDHIIAVSQSTRDDIVNLLGVSADRITVIYEATDPSFQPIDDPERLAQIREKYDLPDQFVFFVSTVEPRKNIPTLLHAQRLLLDRHGPLAPLIIAGKRGWLFEEVYAVVEELELERDVRFLGRVPQDDLILIYNAATVHVHPAFYEGFGLPPLEAMAVGTPTIVSDVSSLPEVVGDAGWLLPPEDVEGWAAAIGRLVADEDLRADFRQRGFEQANKFSLERMAEETLAIYRQVAQPA
ncbi:MAG: Alpha-maltose-1-phosphate synthase [Anaerolineales bacterium]|nr:Alpha-maltose-1-phosphate synthase [Anaerolineales bacterium]